MIGLLAGLVVLAIVVWIFGSGVARFVGLVLLINGLGGIWLRGGLENPRHGWFVVAGLGLWLFGHWLFAAKRGAWRSRVARAVWRVPIIAWTSPVRG